MSTLNISLYSDNVKTFKRILANNEGRSVVEIISMASLATEVPVLATAYYFGQLIGFTPEILEKIEMLKSFYTYDSILGLEAFDLPKEEIKDVIA